MSTAFIDPSMPDKKQKMAHDIISKYNGLITKTKSDADIIIQDLISIFDYQNAQIRTYSLKCLQTLDKELLNPFTFQTESKCLMNLHLRNKTFNFINCSEKVAKICTIYILMMDGKIQKNNPDYYLTDNKSIEENSEYISTDWIYSLVNSSLYIYPQKYLVKNLSKFMPKQSKMLDMLSSSSNFQYSEKFIQKAYELQKANKYSFPRLKKELEQISDYSNLCNENIKTFIDACQIGFAQLRARKERLDDIYKVFLNTSSPIIDKKKKKKSYLRTLTLCGDVKHSGRWSESETRQLIFILEKGKCTKEMFNKFGNIDWCFIASHVNGRDAKSCEDKYRSMLAKNEIEEIQQSEMDPIPEEKFNKMLHKAFTPAQETEILNEILDKIDQGIPVTKLDISSISLDYFYSPLNLSMKAVIFSYLDKGLWPFDSNGDINITSLEDEVNKILPLAQDEPENIMDKYNIKQFKGSPTWVSKFMLRHKLVHRECHIERRGAIDEEEVDQFLSQLADAMIIYKPRFILNMDQTFINTYNPPHKQITKKGESTVKIIKERMNQKEGTTYLSTISMDSDLKLPLFIVARGRSELCEKKHEINTENDDFISHSLNGWTTVNIMVEYLNWISEKMDNQPFALLLDSYKAHKHPTVIEEAKKLGIDLIYIPSCGTAKFQPLDRFVFGFLKKKIESI